MGEGIAQALDGRTVRVRMPAAPDARVAFLADIENLPVDRAAPAARGDQRAHRLDRGQPGGHVAPCAVAHGSLSVTISNTPVVSQPNAAGQRPDRRRATRPTSPSASRAGSLIQLPAGTQLVDVVEALNSLGATPQDLLAILQAIKAAGALNAELEVI